MKGDKYMYHYLQDKEFLSKMRTLSGEIMQKLCHNLKEDYGIGAQFYLVGSGARNLITQNNDNPIDLDYNLEIIKCEMFKDGRYLKECARKSFNKTLKQFDLDDCDDSTSTLTSKRIYFTSGNKTEFSIDICVTFRDNNDNYYRLIHNKTGFVHCDEFYWNMAPNSSNLKEKTDYIKSKNYWELVRKQYLHIKNMYLQRNDYNHSSFICYIEAVNNVYNSICKH